jgi:hypothetical protein
MPEPTKYSLTEAALADGTIDFYVMLGEAGDSPTEQLRQKIQSLYNEAQANRDHRNLTRRREYQTLIELLPGARAALLDADKRQRYDAYLAAARAGSNSPEFEEFMTDIMDLNEKMEERTGLLGVQDKEPRARTIKAPATRSPAQSTQSTAPAADRPGYTAIAIALIGAIAGGLLGYLLLPVGTKPAGALLVAIIIGLILFVLMDRKPGSRIGN